MSRQHSASDPMARTHGRAGAGASSTPGARRWHTHGWNAPFSWKLIFMVFPRLPRFIVAPLRHAVTLTCFAAMPRERRAVRRNLARITGLGGFDNLRLAYRLFHNFSRVMTAYAGMKDLRRDELQGRVSGLDTGRRVIDQALAGGRGVILLTMHIGHWDLGLKLLSVLDVPVHVVMQSEDPLEVSRFADEARHFPALKVHQTGSSPLLAVELMAALQRGELVAVQADRPAGGAVMPVRLFGADAMLPTGPAMMAMATGALILPVFVLFDGADRYRLVALEPLRFERPREGGAGVHDAMGRIARLMESVVSEHPDQWFNFFDIWPVEPADGSGGERDVRRREHA